VIFAVEGETMVLLHAFIMKGKTTPRGDLKTARQRLVGLHKESMENRQRIGSDFDDFLREEGALEATEAAAIKRVIAFQFEQEMNARGISKSEMASRMKTSRASLERLLDPANTSVTLSTLSRAAAALDRRLQVHFTEPASRTAANRTRILARAKTPPSNPRSTRSKRAPSRS
jgi:hypothetical protein